MIIVCFNGPPYCGKDTLARMLCKKLTNGIIMHLQNDLVKRPVHASFGLTSVADDAFELMKDKPHELFFGLTPRQAYINHSELYMKNLYGRDILSKLMMRKFIIREKLGAKFAIFPSLGFQEELDMFKKYYKTCVFRVFRNETSFKNDSRGYVTHDWLYEIQNDLTLDEMQKVMNDFAEILTSHYIKITAEEATKPTIV